MHSLMSKAPWIGTPKIIHYSVWGMGGVTACGWSITDPRVLCSSKKKHHISCLDCQREMIRRGDYAQCAVCKIVFHEADIRDLHEFSHQD